MEALRGNVSLLDVDLTQNLIGMAETMKVSERWRQGEGVGGRRRIWTT